jgi:hypothetical protein
MGFDKFPHKTSFIPYLLNFQHIAAMLVISTFLLICMYCGIHQKNCDKDSGLFGAQLPCAPYSRHIFAGEHSKEICCIVLPSLQN